MDLKPQNFGPAADRSLGSRGVRGALVAVFCLSMIVAGCARTGIGRGGSEPGPDIDFLDSDLDAGEVDDTAESPDVVEPRADAPLDAALDAALDAVVDTVVDTVVDLAPDVLPDEPDAPGPEPEDCVNAIDDDLDGLIDCDDIEDCGSEPICLIEDPFDQISTGRQTCGVHVSGAISCWASVSDLETAPVASAEQVEVGGESACARRRDGTVACWGFLDGEVQEIPLPADALHVTQSAWSHACAVLRGGQVWCWGVGDEGQLGDGLGVNSDVPVRVVGIEDAVMVSAGTEHTCALHATGSVSCWGRNFTGRLGTGNSLDTRVPAEVNNLRDAVWIAAGAGHTCAVDSARAVWCWGRNNYGQLGVGDNRDRFSPTRVEVLTRASGVTAGMFHTCAIRSGGAPFCWGYNRFGQLGNGTSTDSTVPLRVPGLLSSVGVDAGWTHACSISSAGLVSCWGGTFENTPVLLCDESFAVEACGCSNGIDDDFDGAVDCLDDECATSLECLGLECVPPSNVLPEFFAFRRLIDSLTSSFEMSGSCGGAGQREVVYSWIPPTTQRYAIELLNSPGSTVWARRGRCDGVEIGCDTDDVSRIEVRAPVAGTPLVIGFENPSGGAELSIGPVLERSCGDEVDNDFDGRTDCADEDCRFAPGC